MGKCKVFMLSLCRQTVGQTDGRTTVKQYAPDLSIREYKNTQDIRKARGKAQANVIRLI